MYLQLPKPSLSLLLAISTGSCLTEAYKSDGDDRQWYSEVRRLSREPVAPLRRWREVPARDEIDPRIPAEPNIWLN